MFPYLLLRRSPLAARHSPQRVYVCLLWLCVKLTCGVKWIIVRERRTVSASLSRPDLAGSRGKIVSRHLELSPDAVDDHDFSIFVIFLCSLFPKAILSYFYSVMPCHALHAAASPFRWTEADMTGPGKSGYADICLALSLHGLPMSLLSNTRHIWINLHSGIYKVLKYRILYVTLRFV